MVLDFNINVRANSLSICSNIAFFPSQSTEQEVEVTLQSSLAQLAAEIAELETMSRELVQNQQRNEQQILEAKVESGVQQLEQIAHRVNILAAQLETEMRNFKEVAVEVNRCYHICQQLESSHQNQPKPHRWTPLNIWDIHFSSIPAIIKRGNKFIFVEKVINLFK
ncbi:MAG: hypothetical protein IGS39_03800 [Calothrix sp. C42_A2020_038]|nr:hypothetical protein [Calothrix sp. C42_A2020_038]